MGSVGTDIFTDRQSSIHSFNQVSSMLSLKMRLKIGESSFTLSDRVNVNRNVTRD